MTNGGVGTIGERRMSLEGGNPSRGTKNGNKLVFVLRTMVVPGSRRLVSRLLIGRTLGMILVCYVPYPQIPPALKGPVLSSTSRVPSRSGNIPYPLSLLNVTFGVIIKMEIKSEWPGELQGVEK